MLWEGKEKEVAEASKVSRLGEVEDVAYAVGYIASEQASYVNGETLVVAGKTSARL
jgi:NAD(P)-dependent dehydrogenase (short-subunit alcohol dehydrogenase family)